MVRVSALLDDLIKSQSPEAMMAIVSSVRDGHFSSDDLHNLATALANSGAILHPGNGVSTADIASTGSPSSLSTLLGPLHLRNFGFCVPKLGVAGRPAGGIDVMAQLRGFRTTLGAREIRGVLDRCGYAHFLAGRDFTPLDAALFGYRQQVGAQNVPALVTVSILAKKIACGVKFAGLDVRVGGHGNFGATFPAAAAAARQYCETAKLAGITGLAFLTDARFPYQPYIGRGESLWAMSNIFSGRAEPWLVEHDDACRAMAAHVSVMAGGIHLRTEAIPIGEHFERHIVAHGSSVDEFAAKVELVSKAERRELTAKREGFVRFDLEGIRTGLTRANSLAGSCGQFPDAAGLVLRAKPGSYVRAGDALASLRVGDRLWEEIGDILEKAIDATDIPNPAPAIGEVVRA
jgi:thymidine phosphorylase